MQLSFASYEMEEEPNVDANEATCRPCQLTGAFFRGSVHASSFAA